MEQLHFNIRVLERGQAYGLDDQLTADAPMIEFYDPRFIEGFTEHGQFVARYYIDTLEQDRERLERLGLCLCGHVAAWSASASQMREVFATIDQRKTA